MHRALTIAALALATSAHASDAALQGQYAAARADFRAAYARVMAGAELSDSSDSRSLERYPLYPYLQAARIRVALDGPTEALGIADARAAQFTQRYGTLPVSRGLERAWLESLARRARWSLFLHLYASGVGHEALRCQSFLARIELGETAGLAREVAQEWLNARSLPDCTGPFAWLRQRGELTTALIEQRARLALASGNAAFAREIIDDLPAAAAAPLREWAGLLERPQRAIDALIATPGKAVEPEALLEGWTLFARTDPQAAKARYADFVRARRLSDSEASRFARALALALAWDRDPAALDYFARVAPADLDDEALEWRARAALWSMRWSEALSSIEALSAASRATPRWRYWYARAIAALDGREQARPLYESLLTDDDFYSALAATRLGLTVAPHEQPLPVDPARLAALGGIPALVRARELFFCGMRTEASAEWRFAYDALDTADRLQLIALTAEWGWYDQAVQAATAQHVFNDYALLYPQPFDTEVAAAAQLAQIAPGVLYGVVRQESLYRTDAVSSVGARGLMQLMLDTARRTARRFGLPRPAPEDLFRPAVNIPLGAARLRMLLDQLGGQFPVALAGYNAGLSAVLRWLPQQPLDTDIWIENIPYNETREYVERTLWHTLLYGWLEQRGRPQHADAWLVPVKPLAAPEDSPRVADTGRQRSARVR